MDRTTARSNAKPECVGQYQSLNARESEVSLTPSQVSRRDKTNLQKKNPLDSITKAPKINQYLEKRSGLQNVSEEEFQQMTSFSYSKSKSRMGQRELNNGNQSGNNPNAQAQNDLPAAGQFHKPQQEQNVEQKAPPSEPVATDNTNAPNIVNETEKGFCTTCPNCAAKILLVPENGNKAEDNPPPQANQ